MWHGNLCKWSGLPPSQLSILWHSLAHSITLKHAKQHHNSSALIKAYCHHLKQSGRSLDCSPQGSYHQVDQVPHFGLILEIPETCVTPGTPGSQGVVGKGRLVSHPPLPPPLHHYHLSWQQMFHWWAGMIHLSFSLS